MEEEVKKKKRIIGRPFEKGNKFGKGRPKLTDEDKELRKLSREKFKTIVLNYLDLTSREIDQKVKDKEMPALDAMIVSIMSKSIKTGDEKRLNWFLEQCFGKIKEVKDINLAGSVDTSRQLDLSKLSDEEVDTVLSIMKRVAGGDPE